MSGLSDIVINHYLLTYLLTSLSDYCRSAAAVQPAALHLSLRLLEGSKASKVKPIHTASVTLRSYEILSFISTVHDVIMSACLVI